MKFLPMPLMIATLLVLAAATAFAQSEPVLTVTEAATGSWTFQGLAAEDGLVQVLAGTPLQFSWLAGPGDAADPVDAYRYGWDLVDPEDPFDPGWEVPWQLVLSAPARTFQDGAHSFTVQVRDDLGRLTRGRLLVFVTTEVPVGSTAWDAVKATFRGR